MRHSTSPEASASSAPGTLGDAIGHSNVLWVVTGVCLLLLVLFGVFALTLGTCAFRRGRRSTAGSSKPASSIGSLEREDERPLIAPRPMPSISESHDSAASKSS